MSSLDEILKAANLGRTIGDPIARGMEAGNQRQFENQQLLKKMEFDRQMQQMANEAIDARQQRAETDKLRVSALLGEAPGLTAVPGGMENVPGMGNQFVAQPKAIGETEQSNIDAGVENAALPRDNMPVMPGVGFSKTVQDLQKQRNLDDVLKQKDAEAKITSKYRRDPKQFIGVDTVSGKPILLDTGAGETFIGNLPDGSALGAKPVAPKGGSGSADKAFDLMIKNTNPINASSRTVLGIAGQSKMAGTRGLDILLQPVVTNQMASGVATDIARILKGGSPDQLGMDEQEYRSLEGKVAQAIQYFNGKPQDALPAELKNQMISVLKDMNKRSDQIIKDNFESMEDAYPDVVERHREAWEKYKAKTLGGDFGQAGAQGKHPLVGTSVGDYKIIDVK